LQTIFNRCEGFLGGNKRLDRDRSILMVLKTVGDDGVVFGAYLTNNLHQSERYYGERECFVWRFLEESENTGCGGEDLGDTKKTLTLQSFSSTRQNNYYIYCHNCIAIGGGAIPTIEKSRCSASTGVTNPTWAIFLSPWMEQGSSYFCDTFGSPPLVDFSGRLTGPCVHTSFELKYFEIWGFQKGMLSIFVLFCFIFRTL
jgi:hypothetical protein